MGFGKPIWLEHQTNQSPHINDPHSHSNSDNCTLFLFAGVLAPTMQFPRQFKTIVNCGQTTMMCVLCLLRRPRMHLCPFSSHPGVLNTTRCLRNTMEVLHHSLRHNLARLAASHEASDCCCCCCCPCMRRRRLGLPGVLVPFCNAGLPASSPFA